MPPSGTLLARSSFFEPRHANYVLFRSIAPADQICLRGESLPLPLTTPVSPRDYRFTSLRSPMSERQEVHDCIRPQF